jgi:uncharacterized phage protein (TIGR02218 family)
MYTPTDNSAESGQPIYLYVLTNDLGTYRYTSRETEVVYDTNTYVPETISHGSISNSGDMTKDRLDINFPITNDSARDLMIGNSEQPSSITVLRGHSTDDDFQFIVYWKGRVVNVVANNATVKMECESIFTSLRRYGLRARYQKTCRHNLYSEGCGVDKEDFKVEGEVSALNDLVLTIAEAEDFDDGYFTGGYINFNGVTRRIVAHQEDQVTIARALEALKDATLPAAIDLYPGCDKLRTTCNNKFDNLPNFGGFPWIPIRNPFGGSSII